MADIRAKFYVAEVTRYPGTHGKVVCRAVSRGAVNRSFSAATPTGEITLTITNPDALEVYDQWRIAGREFYVDFTEYTPQPGDGHAFVLTEGDEHYNRGKCVECGAAEEDHAAA